jgi:hypothetical protein
MNNVWATEQLQTIRTLMERTALYRRAMAPVSIISGVAGVTAGFIGWHWRITATTQFCLFWASVALVAGLASLLLIRRQAFKDAEPFWSPPTRRVAQAISLPVILGAVFALMTATMSKEETDPQALVIVWLILYGCGLHAAGFFMPRGIRWLGWIFAFSGVALLATVGLYDLPPQATHLQMAATFGGLHLIYGVYLHFTETKSTDHK